MSIVVIKLEFMNFWGTERERHRRRDTQRETETERGRKGAKEGRKVASADAHTPTIPR